MEAVEISDCGMICTLPTKVSQSRIGEQCLEDWYPMFGRLFRITDKLVALPNTGTILLIGRRWIAEVQENQRVVMRRQARNLDVAPKTMALGVPFSNLMAQLGNTIGCGE